MDITGIERFVEVNGRAECVTFRFEFVDGARPEELSADADAMLLPYRAIDAIGVATSAVARRLPVLARVIRGLRDLFGGESGARLVLAALSQVMIGRINAPERRDALNEGMHRRRASIPSWNEIARLHPALDAQAYARWTASQTRQSSQSFLQRAR